MEILNSSHGDRTSWRIIKIRLHILSLITTYKIKILGWKLEKTCSPSAVTSQVSANDNTDDLNRTRGHKSLYIVSATSIFYERASSFMCAISPTSNSETFLGYRSCNIFLDSSVIFVRTYTAVCSTMEIMDPKSFEVGHDQSTDIGLIKTSIDFLPSVSIWIILGLTKLIPNS